MDNVYLVTDGEYSDYQILGIYSTREKAEHAKELWNAKNEIEEFKLDEMLECPPGMRAWTVKMLRDGDVKEISRATPEMSMFANDEKHQYISNPGLWGGKYYRSYLVSTVWAENETHAAKIVNEKRAQLIAIGAWQSDVVKLGVSVAGREVE